MVNLKCLSIVFLLALPTSAVAENEDGLYGSVVPDGAVFVRSLVSQDGSFTVFGRTLAEGTFPAQDFVAFAPDALPLADPGAHYSVVVTKDGGVATMQEPDRKNPAKVYLTLLNASEYEVGLVVGQDGAEVIAPIAQGDAANRAVNPVSATLSIRSQDASRAFDVVLRRKQNISFFVDVQGTAQIVEDTYGAVFGAK